MRRIKSSCASWLTGGILSISTLSAVAQDATIGKPPTAYVDFALAHAGTAEHGREIFTNTLKAACVNCHTTDGSANHAGPDLSSVGDKFSRRELIRSVLEPSSTIAVGYATTIVEMKSGEVFQGVIKQATDEWIELMGGDGKPTRLMIREIQRQRASNVSLMPEGLQSTMTLQDFTDLIAYVESLRQTPNTLTTGMIPIAAVGATFEPFFHDNIKLIHPTWFGEVPGRTNLFVVLEHFGKSWIIERTSAGDTQSTLVDLSAIVRSGGGCGMLGLAFHPHFQENRKYYLKYQVAEDGRVVTLIDERKFAPNADRDSGEPGRIILKIPGTTPDHHGGCLGFGPDGFLYIAMGDTGPQGDPQGHSQDLKLLTGKILRLDVDHTENGKEYAVPKDNPFLGRPGAAPEIWAYGFREPWRFSFDSVTHDLWVGDVGQDKFEEVSIVRAGENDGWNVFEGFNHFSDRYRRDGEHYVPPIFSYSHGTGVSITGGYVYRGVKAPALNGWYICADFQTCRVWALTQTNRVLQHIFEIGRAPSRVVSFAQDQSDELYTVGYDSGLVYKLDLAPVKQTLP